MKPRHDWRGSLSAIPVEAIWPIAGEAGLLSRMVHSHMKAAVYNRGVVQIKDVEKPVPKDNEVFVRIHAIIICAAD